MPRYFLHLRDGTDIALDKEGSEFDSIEALRLSMIRSARDLMTGDVVKGEVDLTLRIDAEAADGTLVVSVPFTEVVRIKYPQPEARRATG